MKREPSYSLHKSTGQAYIRIEGKMHYLGAYGSELSHERYRRLKLQWLQSPEVFKARQSAAKTSRRLTMAELCIAYLEHCRRNYSRASQEAEHSTRAVAPISELYASLPAEDFGPREYKACRDWWISPDRSRTYINAQARRLVRLLKWGVGEGLIPPAVWQAVKAVEPLKRNRTAARETGPVRPVDADIVAKTIEHLPPVVADMVKLQLLLGCRPGELCRLKPCMVDRSEDPWTITLHEHKTAHHGHERFLYAGPKAQRILAKYLLRDQNSHCFSPAEAQQQRRDKRTEGRRTPPNEGNAVGTNRKATPKRIPKNHYDTGSYDQAIWYACRAAFPPPARIEGDAEAVAKWNRKHKWCLNQLRHSRATEIRKVFGLEAASAVLGHSDVGITQVYAEADRQRAREVALKTG